MSHIEMEENVVVEQSSEIACSPDDHRNAGKVPATSGCDKREDPEVVRKRKITKQGIIP